MGDAATNTYAKDKRATIGWVASALGGVALALGGWAHTKLWDHDQKATVQAERDQPARIQVDALIMPVVSVDEAGRAKCMPVPVGRQGFAYDLADLPPELATGVAIWLAQQADPLGRRILAQLYPEPTKKSQP